MSRCSSSTARRASAPATRRSPTCSARAACRSCWPRTRSTTRRTSGSSTTSTALGWASRWPSRRRRGSAPATCWTGSSGCCPRAATPQKTTTTSPPRRAGRVGPPPGTAARKEAGHSARPPVMGRQTVGKPPLVNPFLGRERVIVPDIAGPPRDAIDTPIEVDGRKLLLVDTAGIRRAAKVSESVEYYTTLRSQRAAERADVALVVCDAQDGVTSQDLRVAEMAMHAGCATALVLNKWDLTGGAGDPLGPGGGVGAQELDRERARVNQKLRLRPRVLTASAKTGRHIQRLLQESLAIADRARHRIPTPELNRFLADVTTARQPPAKQGHRLKMLYMAQIGTRPPRFAIQVNSRQRVTRDYAYFVENRLRERYAFEGVPVIIDFNERRNRRTSESR